GATAPNRIAAGAGLADRTTSGCELTNCIEKSPADGNSGGCEKTDGRMSTPAGIALRQGLLQVVSPKEFTHERPRPPPCELDDRGPRPARGAGSALHRRGVRAAPRYLE